VRTGGDQASDTKSSRKIKCDRRFVVVTPNIEKGCPALAGLHIKAPDILSQIASDRSLKLDAQPSDILLTRSFPSCTLEERTKMAKKLAPFDICFDYGLGMRKVSPLPSS